VGFYQQCLAYSKGGKKKMKKKKKKKKREKKGMET